MKKIALALACSLMAVSAPAQARCPKENWTFSVHGQVMDGYGLIAFTEAMFSVSGLSFLQASHLLQTVYNYRTLDRKCR